MEDFITQSQYFDLPPVNSIDDNTKLITFMDRGSSAYCIDHSATTLHLTVSLGNFTIIQPKDFLPFLQARILKANGDHLVKEDEVGTVTLLAHSMFKTANLELNGVGVGAKHKYYPISAFVSVNFNYDKQGKKFQCPLNLPNF